MTKVPPATAISASSKGSPRLGASGPKRLATAADPAGYRPIRGICCMAPWAMPIQACIVSGPSAVRTVRLALVVGSPGVGKSRLAAELVRRTKGVTALWGRCLSYGDGITYWPLFRLSDGEFVGCCGLKPHPDPDTLALGFHLRPDFWGQGYASEAARAVIARNYVLTGDWQAMYDELQQFRKACGDAHMKTILATGELGTLKNIYQASLVSMMAGSDFIKTSTGKEPTNATLDVSLVMIRALRDYLDRFGYKVGFKPAGGISSAKQALAWQSLMKEELGDEWLKNDLFRFGASSLLTDIERQLYHYLTGHYAAKHHMPMG